MIKNEINDENDLRSVVQVCRDKLELAWSLDTNIEKTIDDLPIYKDSKVLERLNKSICSLLNIKPAYNVITRDTVRKFRQLLPAPLNKTIKENIDAYLAAAKEKAKERDRPIGSLVKGFVTIDAVFRSQKKVASINMNVVDFYTTKIDGDIQWLGVAKGLSCDRPLLTVVEAEILKSLSRKSKIIAGVIGTHGVGKSTFLRKLALNCIKYENKFKILWIENLAEFDESFKNDFANNGQQYVAIIEDWTKMRDNNHIEIFFENLIGYKNLKLVVGDVTDTPKWVDYLYGNNIYDLPSDDNERIIFHILDNVPEWRDVAKKALINKDLYEAPLFLIIFVIAKVSEGEGNILRIDTDDFKSQFQSIIKKDIRKIYKKFPNLSKALYYWACATTNKENNKFYLTWPALLKWANYYKDNEANQLKVFNKKNPYCKILSYYISFDKVIDPFSNHEYFISFLHDSFVEAFCYPPRKDWYFITEYLLDTAEIFKSLGMLLFSRDFFYTYEKAFRRENSIIINEKFLGDYIKYAELFYGTERHKNMYLSVGDYLGNIKFEIDANNRLRKLINKQYDVFDNPPTFSLHLSKITRKTGKYKEAHAICNFLIENGCNHESIKLLKEAPLTDEGFAEFTNSFPSELLDY